MTTKFLLASDPDIFGFPLGESRAAARNRRTLRWTRMNAGFHKPTAHSEDCGRAWGAACGCVTCNECAETMHYSCDINECEGCGEWYCADCEILRESFCRGCRS